MGRALTMGLVIGCAACTSALGSRPTTEDAGPDAWAVRDAGTDAALVPDAAIAADGWSVPIDAWTTPAIACTYRSTTYDAPPVTLDVGPGSPERLTFVVPGVPDPALVTRATLAFTSHDADHPGEEGVVRVNGTVLDLPAMLAWNDADAPSTIDVTGALVPGTNTITFGPGGLARSVFSIAALRLDVTARVETCVPPPDPRAVERRLHFHEGTFTNRPTWVVPCPPGHPRFAAIRDYAFTASGAEHESTDCDGLYRAGSGERGTATYVFDAVVPATYGIYVSFRTSANRNPRGALFLVDGEERRIDQVDPSGAFREVLWGDRALSGTVTVVLDSSRDTESDSVTEIRLTPR